MAFLCLMLITVMEVISKITALPAQPDQVSGTAQALVQILPLAQHRARKRFVLCLFAEKQHLEVVFTAPALRSFEPLICTQKSRPFGRLSFIGANRETRTPDPLITNLAKHLNLLSFKHLYLNVFFFTGKRLQKILLIVNLF